MIGWRQCNTSHTVEVATCTQILGTPLLRLRPNLETRLEYEPALLLAVCPDYRLYRGFIPCPAIGTQIMEER